MGGTGRALLGVLAGGYSFSTAHGRLDFCCWWGHGETKARSSFCPQTQFQPPLAQNARGASQHTGITLLVGGGVGGHPSLPGPCGCWEQLTVAGDSCPVLSHRAPGPERCRVSGRVEPWPLRPAAPPCAATAFSSPSAPWQVRGVHPGGAAWGGTQSPPTFAFGGLSLMGVQRRAPSHGVSPCCSPLFPCPALQMSLG